MSRTRIIIVFGLTAFIFGLFLAEFKFAVIPDNGQILNRRTTEFLEEVAYDVQGVFISSSVASELEKDEDKRELLKAENGAIRIDEDFVQFGKELFYKETFDNEIFMTDILGFLDGPLTLGNFAKALIELKGKGTTNLQVELAEDVTIGEYSWKKGEKVNTGLDVPKGSLLPLGIPLTISDGRVRIGVSCAACHASVDKESGKVIEGAPNIDFDSGLLMALATNTSAFFTTAEINSLKDYIIDMNRTVINSKGEKEPLPDPDALEKAVDETFVKWPKGNFDTTPDLSPNPTQTPDIYTYGDHPYTWSGSAMVGPFKGLSTFNNKVHSLNSDPISLSGQSEELVQVDKEVFIGTILQRAANKRFRFDPTKGEKPSEFFAKIDESPDVPGINEGVKPPHFPKLSMVTPNGTIVTSKGRFVGEENNAMAAYENTLLPPAYDRNISKKILGEGRDIFKKAGCISCHAGRAYSSNRIIPVEEIKTEPNRAKAFEGIEDILGESIIWAPNTPNPVPKDAKVLKVPIEQVEEDQRKLAFLIGDNNGGYKTKGLIGLAYSAPYLHDGGVAVGKDEKTELGIPGTLMKGKEPDPYNSLKALIDKQLRQKVINANRAEKSLIEVHVDGKGHEYWVDKTNGYTEEQQKALIEYLWSLTELNEED